MKPTRIKKKKGMSMRKEANKIKGQKNMTCFFYFLFPKLASFILLSDPYSWLGYKPKKMFYEQIRKKVFFFYFLQLNVIKKYKCIRFRWQILPAKY